MAEDGLEFCGGKGGGGGGTSLSLFAKGTIDFRTACCCTGGGTWIIGWLAFFSLKYSSSEVS